MNSIEIREELPTDRQPIRDVELAAFETRLQADLVDVLRQSKPHLSLVAAVDNQIVGHIFFSAATIESEGAPPAAQLSPIAVHPRHQGIGIGSDLIRVGLRESRNRGWEAIFLLGDPAYYERFGFTLARPFGFEYQNPVFAPDLQVCELRAGVLQHHRGVVRFHPAFAEAEAS